MSAGDHRHRDHLLHDVKEGAINVAQQGLASYMKSQHAIAAATGSWLSARPPELPIVAHTKHRIHLHEWVSGFAT